MKLFVDKTLGLGPEKINLAGEFCLFCADYLPIEADFKIYMVSEREPHSISTTALYEVGNNVCKVYCKDRALADCLRSIAHEMTHMMQDELGLITGPVRDAGGFHEDQANSRAGELLKLFAKSKEGRKAIYEARQAV
jgi:hypothetical protein